MSDAPAASLCGAHDAGINDDDLFCTLPVCHPAEWHQEIRDGEVWAEWRGPHNRDTPCTPVVERGLAR